MLSSQKVFKKRFLKTKQKDVFKDIVIIRFFLL